MVSAAADRIARLTMGPISLTTTIDAPRERVFDLIVDLASGPAWTDHFLDRLSPRANPGAVGGSRRRFRIDAPGGITYMEAVITEAARRTASSSMAAAAGSTGSPAGRSGSSGTPEGSPTTLRLHVLD